MHLVGHHTWSRTLPSTAAYARDFCSPKAEWQFEFGYRQNVLVPYFFSSSAAIRSTCRVIVQSYADRSPCQLLHTVFLDPLALTPGRLLT